MLQLRSPLTSLFALALAAVTVSFAGQSPARAQVIMGQPSGMVPAPVETNPDYRIGTMSDPASTALTWSSVTCAATSTSLGVTAASYMTVLIPPDATATKVCFSWNASTAATLTPPSQCYGAGTLIKWTQGGTGKCIVPSGTQAITVGVH